MTLDEKLDIFYKAAIEDATKQSVTQTEEYKKSLEQNFQELKKRETKRYEDTYRLESETILREKNKRVSDENLLLKRAVTDKIASFQRAIFKAVEEKLNAYMQTPAYNELLIHQIESEIEFAGDSDVIIYINASDKSKKNALTDYFHREFEISTEEFRGGTRAIIPDRNLLIDNSFQSKLEEEKDNFTLR